MAGVGLFLDAALIDPRLPRQPRPWASGVAPRPVPRCARALSSHLGPPAGAEGGTFPTCRRRGEVELTGRVGGTRAPATATPTGRCSSLLLQHIPAVSVVASGSRVGEQRSWPVNAELVRSLEWEP